MILLVSFNLNFVETILTYGNCSSSNFMQFPCLSVSENEDWIITGDSRVLHLLIKEQTWQLQQTIEIPIEGSFEFLSCQLNEKGDKLIVSTSGFSLTFGEQDEISNCYFFVLSSVNGIWEVIKQIRFKEGIWWNCFFLDDDKFILFDNESQTGMLNLSLWQVFSEIKQAKQLTNQLLQLKGRLYNFRYIKWRDLILVQNQKSLCAIKKNNEEFYIQSQLDIPRGNSGIGIRFIDEKLLVCNTHMCIPINVNRQQILMVFY